jgi:hypothetical protein
VRSKDLQSASGCCMRIMWVQIRAHLIASSRQKQHNSPKAVIVPAPKNQRVKRNIILSIYFSSLRYDGGWPALLVSNYLSLSIIEARVEDTTPLVTH